MPQRIALSSLISPRTFTAGLGGGLALVTDLVTRQGTEDKAEDCT